MSAFSRIRGQPFWILAPNYLSVENFLCNKLHLGKQTWTLFSIFVVSLVVVAFQLVCKWTYVHQFWRNSQFFTSYFYASSCIYLYFCVCTFSKVCVCVGGGISSWYNVFIWVPISPCSTCILTFLNLNPGMFSFQTSEMGVGVDLIFFKKIFNFPFQHKEFMGGGGGYATITLNLKQGGLTLFICFATFLLSF